MINSYFLGFMNFSSDWGISSNFFRCLAFNGVIDCQFDSGALYFSSDSGINGLFSLGKMK